MYISLHLSMLLWIFIWISLDSYALTCHGSSIHGSKNSMTSYACSIEITGFHLRELEFLCSFDESLEIRIRIEDMCSIRNTTLNFTKNLQR